MVSMVYILNINENESIISEDVMYSLLSMQRRDKAETFCRRSDSIRSMIVYILLRMALYREYGITEKPWFEFGNNKKPYLKGSENIFFNLSHCKDAVMCAVGSTEIGVDIQEHSEIIGDSAGMIFHHEEAEYIKKTLCPEREMIRFWSMKEAYGKYLGKGILYALTEVSFAGITEGAWQYFKGAYIISMNLKDHAVSVCSEKPIAFYHTSYSDIIDFAKNIYETERTIQVE